uniref:Uncharacterized protein n=1 Tax=Castor canadensis TaxID=51338 RepID=A0A8C0ZR65_CASCN
MSRPGQCGSRLGILQERDVCELILRVTGLQDEADPNFQLALNFAWSNFRFHRFLDVNSHKIEKTIEGIYEKFVIHSDLSKAASWKRLTQEFLNASLPSVEEIKNTMVPYFDSWFQSLVCCPIAFGPVARQNIMEGEQVVEKTAYFIVARKQRVKGRGWSPNIPFRDTPRMTYCLPPGPTS